MTPMRLVRRQWLDPREPAEVAAAPIAGAVNIPLGELSRRVAELPPRDQEIGIVGPRPLACETIAWLSARGRRGVHIPDSDIRHLECDDDRVVEHLWRPNAFLEATLPRLDPGLALDLACGMGREAVYMAANGWRVTAIDVLPDALARAAEFAARYREAVLPICWLACDLEQSLPSLIAEFDLITIFRYLHRPLIADLQRLLRPGASILCETFTTVHQARHGRPSRSADVLAPGELPRLLSAYEIKHYCEDWRGPAHTARAWAVLPLKPGS